MQPVSKAQLERDRLPQLPKLAVAALVAIGEGISKTEYCFSNLSRGDVRRAALHKLYNATFPAHIGLVTLSGQMLDANWWVRHSRGLYHPSGLSFVLEEYEKSLKFALLVSTFSATESTFRQIEDALATKTPERHTPFKSIYDNMFLRLGFGGDTISVLNMYRLLRNSIHSNTVHNAKGQTINWRNSTFKFESGAVIEFLTWEVLFDLLFDVCDVTKNVVLHPDVQALPATIDAYFS